MTKKEFGAIAALLAAYYPNKMRLDDAGLLETWYAELADLDAQSALAAVRQMARGGEEWPSIAAIRRLAQPAKEMVGQVWAQTIRTVCEYGPYGKWDSATRSSVMPEFSEAVTHALERIGGSRSILEATDKRMLDFMGRDFMLALEDWEERQQLQQLIPSQQREKALPAPQQPGSIASQVISDLGKKMQA
jgi:hypothetical protein